MGKGGQRGRLGEGGIEHARSQGLQGASGNVQSHRPEMAKPLRRSWRTLKKMARDLLGRPRAVWEFRWQGPQDRALGCLGQWLGRDVERQDVNVRGSLDDRESLH